MGKGEEPAELEDGQRQHSGQIRPSRQGESPAVQGKQPHHHRPAQGPQEGEPEGCCVRQRIFADGPGDAEQHRGQQQPPHIAR